MPPASLPPCGPGRPPATRPWRARSRGLGPDPGSMPLPPHDGVRSTEPRPVQGRPTQSRPVHRGRARGTRFSRSHGEPLGCPGRQPPDPLGLQAAGGGDALASRFRVGRWRRVEPGASASWAARASLRASAACLRPRRCGATAQPTAASVLADRSDKGLAVGRFSAPATGHAMLLATTNFLVATAVGPCRQRDFKFGSAGSESGPGA